MRAVSLRLTASQWRLITEHLTRELPNEACGLLGGRAGVVEQVIAVENAARSPVRYRMDPARQLEAMLAIEAAGLELTAIYHSHPNGPATPSLTDIAEAYYPDSLYLICSPD
ncbi:MAG: M67 family metallopeptidase, partial [Anaerolineales bacterium]|nr:M67 family metallopeptidase [Anaerolineales bacterium]